MKKILLYLLLAPFFASGQNFWTEVAPFGDPASYYPRQISIASPSVIWVWGSGSDGSGDYCSLSVDQGQTWNEIPIDLPPATQISSLHALSATTAFLSTFANDPSGVAGVWKTTNAGLNWTQVGTSDFPALFFANFVHFFDAANGLVVSDPNGAGFQIFRTSDGGLTWTQVADNNVPQPLSQEYGYTSIYRTKDNSIWFGTNKGRLFSSTDAGANWSVQQTPLSDFGSADAAGSFDFRTVDEGLLMTKDFAFYRTTDGGASWNNEAPSGIYRNFETIYVTGTDNTYFSIGENAQDNSRGSSYSTDGGQSWIDLNTADTDPVIPITAKFASGTVGFCIGAFLSDPTTLRFFRLTDPLNRLLKADEFGAKKFTVLPNPTEGRVEILGANINLITVFDSYGKTVATNNYNGMTKVYLDLSAWQSGFYFAKIESTEQSTATIKILKR